MARPTLEAPAGRRAERPAPLAEAGACRPATCGASARRRCRSCCGWETARRLLRVVSLLALDFAGVFARDLHRRCCSRRRSAAAADLAGSPIRQTTDVRRLRLPGHGAAVRALGPLRQPRRAPRAARIVVLAVPGHGRRAASSPWSTASDFSSYYIFYGSLFFAIVYRRRRCAALYERRHRRCCCARPATSAARCSSARGDHIEAVGPRAAPTRPAGSTSSASSR